MPRPWRSRKVRERLGNASKNDATPRMHPNIRTNAIEVTYLVCHRFRQYQRLRIPVADPSTARQHSRLLQQPLQPPLLVCFQMQLGARKLCRFSEKATTFSFPVLRLASLPVHASSSWSMERYSPSGITTSTRPSKFSMFERASAFCSS
jgi:hypothetical protein